MQVYLAGGMHQNWRERIIDEVPEHSFIDPSDCPYKTEFGGLTWKLDRLYSSHLCLVYMDKANPSGYDLNFEAGFAEGHAITIWFVCDLEPEDPRYNYFGIIRAVATRHFKSIDEVIGALHDATTATIY